MTQKKFESLSESKRKEFASLNQKKWRDEKNLFLVEGFRAIDQILQAEGDNLKAIVISADELEAAEDLDIDCPIYEASRKDFEAISDTENSQGVIAVVKKKILGEKKFYEAIDESLAPIVLLDELADPGNLGTIIRTAAWFGVAGVILSENTVDVYNPKVVRASVGSIFSIPLLKSREMSQTADELKSKGYKLFVSALDDAADYRKQARVDKMVLVIGNEARGVREGLLQQADAKLKISGNEKNVESLNAAVAAAVLIAHFSQS
jgi:TrmH family RNA methyltransferase